MKYYLITLILATLAVLLVLRVRVNEQIYASAEPYKPTTSWDEFCEYMGMEEYKMDNMFKRLEEGGEIK